MSDSQPPGPLTPRSQCRCPWNRLLDHRWLLAALVLAAILEAVLIVRSPVISRDGVTFIRFARMLPSGVSAALHQQDQHPGYPAMILAARQLLPADADDNATEQWILAARLTTAICGVLVVAVVWGITRQLFADPAADIAAIVAATLPILRQNSADALSDTPHLLLWLTACLLSCLALRQWRLGWFAAAGLASGLAYWVRPEGLSVAIVLCLVTPLAAWRTGGASFLRMATCAATAAVVALATIAPYSLLSSKLLTSKQAPMARPEPVLPYVAHKALVESERVASQLPMSNASTPAAGSANSTAKLSTHVGVIVHTLGEAISELAREVFKALRVVYIPVFLLGCYYVGRHRPPLGPFLIVNALGMWHAALLLYVFFISGYISHRHVLPIVVLAIPACAVGLTNLGVWISARLSMPPRRGVFAAVLVCALIVTPWTLRQVNYSYNHLLVAAQWLDAHAAPGAVVVSNTSLVPFYAHRAETCTDGSAPTVDEAIRPDVAQRCDYVVVDQLIEYFNPDWEAQLAANYLVVKRIAPDHGGPNSTAMTIYQSRYSGHELNGIPGEAPLTRDSTGDASAVHTAARSPAAGEAPAATASASL
ncbi:MAG: glycosyltransferase family 39 protein [Planctomycetales bacterium]|nr:glycosyltransferase family 39 protein [Planctomycetales bacterium]